MTTLNYSAPKNELRLSCKSLMSAKKLTTVSYFQPNLLKNIKELESKLAEIAMELTAERHATQY